MRGAVLLRFCKQVVEFTSALYMSVSFMVILDKYVPITSIAYGNVQVPISGSRTPIATSKSPLARTTSRDVDTSQTNLSYEEDVSYSEDSFLQAVFQITLIVIILQGA